MGEIGDGGGSFHRLYFSGVGCGREYRYEEDRAGTGCRAGSDEHGRLRAGLLRQGQGPAAAGYYQRINADPCRKPRGPAIPPLPPDPYFKHSTEGPGRLPGPSTHMLTMALPNPSPKGAAHRDARTDTWLICVNSVHCGQAIPI
jgi:hypothetical protein